VVPFAIDGFAGVSAIDTSVAGPTVKVVLPVSPPELALIWDVPCAAPLARAPDVIGATVVFDDAQVAAPVRSVVDPSVYVPVALNCWVVPLAIDGFAGVTAIDTSAAGPTVRVVLLVSPPEVALIWDVPCAVLLARPPELMVATVGFEDAQVTELVRSCVLPSE
jgi:hypothetical protein